MSENTNRQLGAITLLLLLPQIVYAAPPEIDQTQFGQAVAPIFEQHCIRCHSPNIEKGDFSIETSDDLMSNEFVVAGDADGSYLLDLVTGSENQPPEMPKEGEALSEHEIAALRRWINSGAKWPDGLLIKEKSKADATWWSLQPIKRRPANDVKATAIQQQATSSPNNGDLPQTIDAFVERKLAESGLTQNGPADRRTLIRRLSYDLIGLPPTPQEVEAFVQNTDPDAYEKLVDNLLSSPHYGERWGRHWLDVVRFGESIGYERNVIVNSLWPFRDYVIRSLNEDKPFDQLIREHIAGDVIADNQPDKAVGSAFLVAGPYDDVGNQDAEQAAQIRANTLDEMIRATSEAFLGMTVGCARCHDHKFDPISQQDYYGLYATFAAVRHGEVQLATDEDAAKRSEKLKPLQAQAAAIEQAMHEARNTILTRAKSRIAEYQTQWTRSPVDRTGTEERFAPVTAKFVRLVCVAQDGDPARATGFGIDEFEIWSATEPTRNVALAERGAKATGAARLIEDFQDAYGPQLTIDGKTGECFLARGKTLTIELAEPTRFDRIVFSSAKGEATPNQGKFVFVAEYRIEVSTDGMNWQQVASGDDRQPVNQDRHLDHRLIRLETTDDERLERKKLSKQLAGVRQQIAQLPPLPSVWIGHRVAAEAEGPFHVFLGGSPQKEGPEVVPASLAVFAAANDDEAEVYATYATAKDATEAERRIALANWLIDTNNPLPPRVLANRIWHYHFGTGIVDTPSDFGYMGGRPTHPELLDFLASELLRNNWRIKPLHRQIVLSKTYQQSSEFRTKAAKIDGDARMLWRFPKRRLSAEEIRDTILQVSNRLDRIAVGTTDAAAVPDGGPGFRLYQFLQDNVATYVPLDVHGPDTYRRAVYHQNARASVVDLMTEFDQPDCAFSTPRRAKTTTPLQALTMLNHQFTLDMARSFSERLQAEAGSDVDQQVRRAYALCYSREPNDTETSACRAMIDTHGLPALCRVLLNTSELIYVQ